MARRGVALIGVGMVSSVYASALADLSKTIRLTGVLGRGPESARAFLAAHPAFEDAKTYSDLNEIAADPEVDFAILATPPNARLEPVEVLARAGKHILMEKPVERTLPAARTLCEICEAAGVAFGVTLQHRARPVVAELRGRLGSFGALRAVEISVPWWRPQSYYDAPGRGSYARDGGGVLINQAIHTLDLALTFAGPVREVRALSATSAFHAMESEDFVVAGLMFEGGVPGSLFATTAAYPGRGEVIRLYYEAASVELASNQVQLDWLDGRREVLGAQAATGAGADPMAFTSDWHRTLIADFDEALTQDRAPMIPARSALPVHGLIAAIETAAKQGDTAIPERD